MSKKIICFIGIDGSGKTTEAGRLYRGLYILNQRAVYIHHHYSILNHFKSGEKIKRFAMKATKSKKPNKILAPLFCLAAVLNSWVSYWKEAKHFDGTIVYDRYYYDQLMPYLGGVPRWYGKMCIKMIKKPDTIYYLYVSPEVAMERDGGNDIEFYKYQKSIMDRFVDMDGEGITKINNE